MAELRTRIVYASSAAQQTVRCEYRLTAFGTPPQNGATARVWSYGPGLTAAGPAGSGPAIATASGAPAIWNSVERPLTLTEPGTYFHVVAAQDAGTAQDKGHRNQWGLPLAKPESKPLALNVDFGGYPVPPPLGTTPLAAEAARRQGVIFDGSGYAGEARTNLSAREWIDEIRTRKPALAHYVGHGGSQFIGNQYYLTPWKPGLAGSAIGWSYLIHMDHPNSPYPNTNWFTGLSGLFNKRAGSTGPIVCLGVRFK